MKVDLNHDELENLVYLIFYMKQSTDCPRAYLDLLDNLENKLNFALDLSPIIQHDLIHKPQENV